jgi:hypothetical protein
MQAGDKIREGIAWMGLFGITTFTSVGQTMTLTFESDGSAIRKNTAPSGISYDRYDASRRVVESIEYFPDGKLIRLSDQFKYDNNLLTEHTLFLFGSGYERNVFSYDSKGNRTLSRHLSSENGTEWVEDEYKEEAYDSKGNRTYFNCRSSRYGSFFHLAIKTNYNYQTNELMHHEFDYDQKGNVIETRTSKGSIGAIGMQNTGDFAFDLYKHGPNLRNGRVVKWNGKNQDGKAHERVFMDEYVWSQVVDQKGRITRISMERAGGYENDIPQYTENEWFEYRYDSKGVLIEIEHQHLGLAKEKTTFSHSNTIVAKHYQQVKNGTWSLVDTKTLESIAEFTPPVQQAKPTMTATESISATPPATAPPLAPIAESTQNTQIQHNDHHAIVQDLEELPSNSGERDTVLVGAMDAERLSHVADLLSHVTGATITEADVMALAMQVFIDTYKTDLREMNTAYLREKVRVFD